MTFMRQNVRNGTKVLYNTLLMTGASAPLQGTPRGHCIAGSPHNDTHLERDSTHGLRLIYCFIASKSVLPAEGGGR